MFQFILTHTPLLYLTQSLWRDEAFSVLFAQKSLGFILSNSFPEPPVYYILLHFWIQLFGTSEIAIRSLSLMGYALAVILVIFWAEKLYKHHIMQWFQVIFFALNPVTLYYAFEARAYSWYMLWIIASLYCYTEKRWKLLTVANIIGVYTHSYMIFVILGEVIHYIYTHHNKFFQNFKQFILSPFTFSLGLTGISMGIWGVWLFPKLHLLRSTWYYPVDLQLILSSLGNQLTGYEGTPGNLWLATTILSACLIYICWQIIHQKIHQERNLFFVLSAFIPLGLVLGISLIKPIYVLRYVLPTTIAEIFLICFWIDSIKSNTIKKYSITALIVLLMLFHVWSPPLKAKLDTRSTVHAVNALIKPGDVVYAMSPLVLFEAKYYSADPTRVYLYNPRNSPFPWYVGGSIVVESDMAQEFPMYPNRAFMIYENGSFTAQFQTTSPGQINNERI